MPPEPAEPPLPPEPPVLPVPPLPVAPAIPVVSDAASLPGSVVSDPHATNWDNTNRATLLLVLIILMLTIYYASTLFGIRPSPYQIEHLPIIRDLKNHLRGAQAHEAVVRRNAATGQSIGILERR